MSLDELASMPGSQDSEKSYDRRLALDRLLMLIHALQPVDRQVMLLYLEGVDAASIGEITGISSVNVATKVHRIKQMLAQRFHKGGAS